MSIRISLDKEGEMEVHGGDWGRRERERCKSRKLVLSN